MFKAPATFLVLMRLIYRRYLSFVEVFAEDFQVQLIVSSLYRHIQFI